MRFIHLFLPGITLLFFCQACRNDRNSDLTESEKSKILEEVRTIVNDFFDPNTVSLETHTALRANQPGYIFAGDGKILFTDYDSYKEYVKAAFQNVRRFVKLKSTKAYGYVLARDAVSYTTEFQGKYIDLKSDTIIHNGCWTFVFKKFGTEWKVIQENGTHLHE